MTDVKNFVTSEILKSGMEATFRAVRPDDKDLLVEAFRNLEAETIYTRFFYHKSSLSEAELAAIEYLDFVKDVGLVVTIPGPEREVIIGAGRYAALPVSRNGELSAEVAFVVEEDYQGQGIAGKLLKHLIQIAREKGITRFEAEVLAGNSAMLKVFQRSGLDLHKRYEGGEIHVTMQL